MAGDRRQRGPWVQNTGTLVCCVLPTVSTYCKEASEASEALTARMTSWLLVSAMILPRPRTSPPAHSMAVAWPEWVPASRRSPCFTVQPTPVHATVAMIALHTCTVHELTSSLEHAVLFATYFNIQPQKVMLLLGLLAVVTLDPGLSTWRNIAPDECDGIMHPHASMALAMVLRVHAPRPSRH